MNKRKPVSIQDYSGSDAEALLRTRERLKLVQTAAGAGIWDVNLVTGENDWSEELYNLLGLNPADTPANFDVWKSVIHPDDRVAAWEQLKQSVREKTALDMEYRINLPTGEMRWLRAIGNTVSDDQGKPIRMLGICLNITSQKKKEEEITELATQRKIALDAARLGWWQYNPVTGISMWDDGYRKIFGVDDYSRPNQEILERIIHPEDLPALWREVENSLDPTNPKPYSTEYRIIRPDGELRWIEAHGTASFEGEGTERHAVNFVGTVQDITERKNSEKEKQRLAATVETERDRFAALVNSITDEIWFADKDRKVTLVNPAVRKEFGNVIGDQQDIAKIAENLAIYRNDGTTRPPAEAPLLRAFYGETITNEEEILRLPSTGELRHRQVNGAPVYDRDGSIIGSVIVVRDITRRKLNQKLIEYNEQRNRVLLEIASELLISQDIQKAIDNICRIVMKFLNCQFFFNFNVEQERLHLNACHGISRKEAKRIEWLDFGVAVCGTVARDGKRIVAENIQNRKDELTKLIKSFGIRAYCCHPLTSGPNVIGTLSFGTMERDKWTEQEVSMMETISGLMSVAIQRKRLEAELIQSRENFERAQMIGSIGSWRLNLLKNELVWSDEVYRIFEVEKGEAHTYESFLSVVHPEDREYVDSKWNEALRGGDYDIEHRVLVNGKIKWVREKAFLEFDENGKLLAGFGITQDISKRKNAESDLERALMRLDVALQNANIGLWEYNLNTGEVNLDERSERMFGLKPGSFEGTFSDFEKIVPEDDLEQIRKAINNTLLNNQPYEAIFRIRLSNGNYRYISARGMLTRDEKGDVLNLSGVNFDITELKEGTENLVSRLNLDLLRSNSDLQQFAYVASHDLQEPLRMVSSFVQLLQMRYADKLDQDANEYINFAVNGSKRMYELINGLLAYSRVQTRAERLTSLNMESVLTKVKENLKLLINDTKARITSDRLPVITADENQMIQVLQNLIENGIKFSRGIPEIHISSKHKKGIHVVSVRDNGIGIEKQYYEKIFRIFQKLHSNQEFKGTGIGLAICKKIVERHGGEIWVDSVPGKGAEFFFTIPG